MKKTLLICSGLIIFVPLICIGADITQKVGVMISNQFVVQNIQDLSFGVWVPYAGNNIAVSVTTNGVFGVQSSSAAQVRPAFEGHSGIIKITGGGYVSVQSTPPTALVHTTDSTKTLSLSDMKIVNSDGSAISNMNRLFVNGETELKTIGKLAIPKVSEIQTGEYKADWPITINYVGYDGPE